MRHIISFSGGKDSTALWLWALRTKLDPVVVFCDTKWEANETYAYLDLLEARLGPIIRLSSEGFEERTRRGGMFPSRVKKWCSPELKIAIFADWLCWWREHLDDDVEVLIGYRREESKAREGLTEREWMPDYDCNVWRPLLDWTLQDVVAEHNMAGVPLNPLYRLGAERVGCWPCIHAPKSEIRLVAEHDPARIERIAGLELEIGYTMFAIEESRAGKQKDAPRRVIPTPIHQVVEWAKTVRGGRSLTLYPEPSGCARWGICDTSGSEGK